MKKLRTKKMSDIVKKLLISNLKEHSDNEKYFDNVVGEDYDNLINSIKTTGVTTPIHVTADMTILSGHQRVRACKELGIEFIQCIIRDDITTEEEKLEHLISSNFGRTENNPTKKREAAAKYVELCGFSHGGYRKSRRDNRTLTQKEIADNLGISERTLQELLNISRNLTPEAKELLDNGTITKTTAEKVLCKLSKEDQLELVKSINPEVLSELTTKQVKELVDQYKSELKNDYERNKTKYLEAQEELQKQKLLKATSQDITSEITKKSLKLKELYDKIFEKSSNLREMNDKSEVSQKAILYIIFRVTNDLRDKRAEVEEKFKQFQKLGLELDENAIYKIDNAVSSMEEFISLLISFKSIKNIESVEVVKYEY